MEITPLTEQQMGLLKRLEAYENQQSELKEGAEQKGYILDLQKRGYLRLSEAFTVFKTPTGTYFAILTEAGQLALKHLERESNLSQY